MDFNPPQHGANTWASSVIWIANTSTAMDLRILVDRNSAEAFVLGGRWAFTAVSHWLSNRTSASGVAVFGSVGTTTSGTVHAMDCAWADAPPTVAAAQPTSMKHDKTVQPPAHVVGPVLTAEGYNATSPMY